MIKLNFAISETKLIDLIKIQCLLYNTKLNIILRFVFPTWEMLSCKQNLPGPFSSPSHTLPDVIAHAQLGNGPEKGFSSILDTYSSKMENYSTHLHIAHSCLLGNLAYSDSGLTPAHSHLHVRDHSCKLREERITM